MAEGHCFLYFPCPSIADQQRRWVVKPNSEHAGQLWGGQGAYQQQIPSESHRDSKKCCSSDSTRKAWSPILPWKDQPYINIFIPPHNSTSTHGTYSCSSSPSKPLHALPKGTVQNRTSFRFARQESQLIQWSEPRSRTQSWWPRKSHRLSPQEKWQACRWWRSS